MNKYIIKGIFFQFVMALRGYRQGTTEKTEPQTRRLRQATRASKKRFGDLSTYVDKKTYDYLVSAIPEIKPLEESEKTDLIVARVIIDANSYDMLADYRYDDIVGKLIDEYGEDNDALRIGFSMIYALKDVIDDPIQFWKLFNLKTKDDNDLWMLNNINSLLNQLNNLGYDDFIELVHQSETAKDVIFGGPKMVPSKAKINVSYFHQKGSERAITEGPQCKRCSSRNTIVTQQRLRGPDEPMTTVVTCFDCGFAK